MGSLIVLGLKYAAVLTAASGLTLLADWAWRRWL